MTELRACDTDTRQGQSSRDMCYGKIMHRAHARINMIASDVPEYAQPAIPIPSSAPSRVID